MAKFKESNNNLQLHQQKSEIQPEPKSDSYSKLGAEKLTQLIEKLVTALTTDDKTCKYFKKQINDPNEL